MAQETQFDTVSTFAPPIIQNPLGAGLSAMADEATNTAVKMLNEGTISRQPRFNDIRKNEDMYNGVVRQALRGRSNIPFDTIVMRGFIDTLMSNIDEQVSLKFGATREQDKLSADMATAVWEVEKSPTKAAWDDHIMDAKFMAALAGRGFMKIRMGNQPKFYSEVEACDHYDMVTEPQGGKYLDNHLFKFQMNIFRTKDELLEAAAEGLYNRKQTLKMIQRYNDADWFKNNTDIFNNKLARYTAFGIDIMANNYVGQPLYRLVEGAMNYKGKWYYIVFSFEAKLWLRFEPLEDVFEWAKEYPGRGPWLSFATHPHPFLFWTAAPADDIRPIGYSMKKVVNLTIDNLEKRNWQQRAYNPRMFPNPTDLLWRPDGLAKATLKAGESIQNGIFEFVTPDTTNITINLTQFLDQFLGQKTGITAEAQGQGKTDKVGILVSNLKQVSNRMNYNNKLYRKMLSDLGVMFDYGLYQYLREPYAVKLIGSMGVRWNDEFTRDDAEKEFKINVTTNLEEDEKNQTMLARRQEIFEGYKTSPIAPMLLQNLSVKWLIQEDLKSAGYSDETVRIAMEPGLEGDEIIYAQAAESIQQIVDGVDYVPLNRNATTGFIMKIKNFAQETYPIYPPEQEAKLSAAAKRAYAKKMAIFDKLIAYAQAHLPIAKSNTQSKAALMQATQAMAAAAAPVAPGTPPAGPGAPAITPAAPMTPPNGQPQTQ